MQQLRAVLSRGRGALIYTAVCLALLLLFRERAWQHVSTLNGDEWQPIQGFIRSNRLDEEPICFLPTWTSGHATDQYKFRGIDVLRSPEDAWEGREEPLSGFWVVAQFDVFDPASVPTDLYPHRDQVTLNGADVHLFRRDPFTLPQTLALRVHEASCILQGPKTKRLELVWSRKGYIIPRDFPNRERFSYLGCYASEARFGGQTHNGIWFHPPPARYSLSIVWPRLKLQPWLAVSGGLRDQIANRRGPDTFLAVILDGKTVETLRFPTKRGWKTFAVDLSSSTATEGRLGFKVWTKNNNSRHFIFDAQFENTRPAETDEPRSRPRSSADHRPKRSQGRIIPGATSANESVKGVVSEEGRSPTDEAISSARKQGSRKAAPGKMPNRDREER